MSEITKSIIKAQLEITAPIKDKINPRFKSSYASLDSIYSAVRDPLHRNGLTLSHTVDVLDGKTYLVTTMTHIGGESVSNKIPMFIENATSQGFASAFTYARRYATCSLLCIPSDEDDDGEAAENPVLSGKQINEIVNLIGDDEELLTRMLKGYGKQSIKEILASEFDPICKRINTLKGSK